MTPRLFSRSLSSLPVCFVALWLAGSGVAHAAVTGRYVRLDAPVSERMVAHEIEVFAGGKNVARQAKFAGVGFKGVDINDKNNAKQLVDGKHDMTERGVTMGLVDAVGPWVELDFGAALALDKVVVWQGPTPTYADRGVRLVSVLDAQRRVVCAQKYDVSEAKGGFVAVPLGAKPGPFAGRVVAPGETQWAPVADLLEAEPMARPPDAVARLAAFERRNSPEGLARLAREFFARVDLSRPELAAVRAKFERGEPKAALDAFRDHWLARIQRVTFLHEHARDARRCGSEGDDLLRGVLVSFERGVLALRFTPGCVDWAGVDAGDKKAVEARRAWLLAGAATRALLTSYRTGGDPRHLAQWCALNDDWAMNIQRDFARAAVDLRDYFVKETPQEFNHLASELAETAKARPDLAKHLSGATLARLLMVVVEEYPPAYWWPCRRTAFNHTFNALNSAYITGQVLADFHAGQRLGRENAEHWRRVWTFNLTRDGSMQEIGDEGHLDMALRLGVFYEQMKKDRPAWFTPAYRAQFEDGFAQMLRYLARHPAPNGMGHRYNFADQFERVWGPTENICRIGNMIPRPTFDARPIYHEPDMKGIFQAMFGAGRDPAQLSPARKAAREQVVKFYGPQFAPPRTVSDWMPYAGLAYLRGSWEPDAPFLNLLGQPTGHPEANGRDWTTEFRWWDHAAPLLHARPVLVNGHAQCPDLGKQTLAPGSKTERLTTASETPVPARWHTSARFDLAEAFYEGDYATLGVNQKERRLVEKGASVRGVRATRLVAQVRGARLFVTADVVATPTATGKAAKAPAQHAFDWSYLAWSPSDEKKPTKGAQAVRLDGAALTLRNGSAPGATVRHFSPVKLAWQPAGKAAAPDTHTTRADFGPPAYVGEERVLRAQSPGGVVVASLLESHARDGDARVKSARDLSSGTSAGFTADLSDGSKLTWLVSQTPQPLTVGRITLTAEALLVHETARETSGLALGAKGAAAVDFEFTARDGQFAEVRPIHRPISPVTIGPAANVFTDRATVTLASATPGVEIHYTLDGAEPTRRSPRYTAPFALADSATVRARAFRPGVTEIPFTAAGTDVTVISQGEFFKRPLKPAAPAAGRLAPGLRWEYCEGTWFALFSHLHLPAVLPAKTTGTTARPLDVSMRAGDGPFSVRQSGWLDAPADGLYTFHAPPEYIGATCEPGYDLRVFVDGEEWSLGQGWHGLGAWTVPLAKGLHRLTVTFADARHRDRTVHNPGLWRGYPTPWVVWKGEAPVLEVTAPDGKRQPLPAAWLKCEAGR